MTIGEKIRKVREAKGMSIKALAALSGIDADTLEKYESDDVKPRFDTRLKLSDILGEDVVLVRSETLDKVCDVSATQEVYGDDCGENCKDKAVVNFSIVLAALLETNETTKEELAANVGLTVSQIDEYLSTLSVPDIVTLSKIADLFDVPADLLLGRSFLSESEKMFSDFIYQIETLTDLNRSGAIPDDLYFLCRNAVVGNFI
ncbi:MAG: XRE family transcriptional regulator [Lachnospiraceae bacterium]|nr:XRE family transcriptional regulator [Ruminococcus sp.]MCM1277276.1 XRE family transcriptional regulator [Lachnospiraceae bacterium]